MSSNLALLEHDQLQMIADFNSSIIEAMISFEDKKTNMRNQNWSEAQILQEEDGFFAKIGKAYDRGKASGSNSVWAGVKAGASELGRQIMKMLKKMWEFLKNIFVHIEAMFKNDANFIRKYEADLIDVYDKKRTDLSQVTFTMNIPSMEAPTASYSGAETKIKEAVENTKNSWLNTVLAYTHLKNKEENKQNKNTQNYQPKPEEIPMNKAFTKDTGVDEKNNLIDIYNKIKFNEKKEDVTVSEFMNKLTIHFPKGYDVYVTNTTLSSMSDLIKRFKENTGLNDAKSMVELADKSLKKVEQKVISSGLTEDQYKKMVTDARLSKADAQFMCNLEVLTHRNIKQALIACITYMKNKNLMESAIVETFANAIDTEIYSMMNKFTEDSKVLDSECDKLISFSDLSYSESFKTSDDLDSVFDEFAFNY